MPHRIRSKYSTFDVFVVKSAAGLWEHRAYGVKNGKRVEPLPKTLEAKYVCRVEKCRYRIDALRAAINRTFGD